jgi:hypothetical protein
MTLMLVPKTSGSFMLDNLDLTGVNAAALVFGWQAPPKSSFTFELHLDAVDGKKIGEASLKGSTTEGSKKAGASGGTMVSLAIDPVTDGKLHKLYLVSNASDPKDPGAVVIQSIQLLSR